MKVENAVYPGSAQAMAFFGAAEELWDMVALAEYPSLAAFRAMATSPQHQAIERHRSAGQLNIRTKPRD